VADSDFSSSKENQAFLGIGPKVEGWGAKSGLRAYLKSYNIKNREEPSSSQNFSGLAKLT